MANGIPVEREHFVIVSSVHWHTRRVSFPGAIPLRAIVTKRYRASSDATQLTVMATLIIPEQ